MLPCNLSCIKFSERVANTRHRAVLTCCYAAGLRISEAVSLRPADIDCRRMVDPIEQGKGRKDCYVMLSPRLPEILRDHLRRTRREGEWLIPDHLDRAAIRQLRHAILELLWMRLQMDWRAHGSGPRCPLPS